MNQKVNWKYEIQQYGTAFAAGLLFFAVLSVYIFFRRGYYDLYIANKAFAGTAAILLGIVLLLGPLSRLFAFPDKYVQYRKELGIVAFLLALAHGIISAFFLSEKFSRLLETFNWPLAFGVAATILLIAIFLISNDRAMNVLGRERWWKLQYWGARIVFIFVFLHTFIMKWPGWVSWYKAGGGKELVYPEWPGGGLLVGWFMAFVVVFRLAEFISPKLGKLAWYASIIALPMVYIATFLWARQFIK